MTRAARVAFGLLVLATLGAFVVTQKLKSSPPLVVRPQLSAVFSPAPHARVRRARVSFWIVHADDVSISLVDDGGQIVRRLVDGRHLPARKRLTVWWNGREDDGAIASDGLYRVRVALLGEGRTIDLEPPIALDTRPPRPLVTDVTPHAGDGPAFLPQRGVRAVTIHLRGLEGRSAQLLIYRTDVTPPRRVGELPIGFGARTATWDGTLGGRPAPAGTYLMGVQVADRSGNVGTFPAPLPDAPGAPPLGPLPGRAGVTIRRLAVVPPLTPVDAGGVAVAYADARGRPYAWALRRLGDAKVLAHGTGRAARLRVRTPHGATGLYALTLACAGGAYRTTVPLVVRASRPHSVLVVLPALTWQGSNPVDDDGDGVPNTLDAGGARASALLARPLANGTPADVAAQEAPLLRFLDANLLRYDLTTDVALATGAGPELAGHRGVVLAGDFRWITPGLRAQLGAYVRGGGRVWSLGIDSLRRTVQLAGGVLRAPPAPQPTDALGARPQQPLAQASPGQTATMTAYQEGRLGLFVGTSGGFSGYDRWETLAGVAPGATLDGAAGPAADIPVIALWTLGGGFAIHTGLPQLAARAQAGDLDASALVQRIWTLLVRG
ncbi:MAG TPA: N,N-dimethylformamidase beta subunit family domain-containing protein [Conexibacter sp.]|nr:N,N-dimethylformamidase beta subunit family domain-containing protein [Conexibacter sp.]